MDLGSGACRHAVYELERRLRIIEADRPAQEAHTDLAGTVSLVVEGHGELNPARRGMSASLLNAIARQVVGSLPVHDLRNDTRAQAALVRSIGDAMTCAMASASGVAEEAHGSAALLFLTPHFFWAARCGAGAIFLSRAGFMEVLSAGVGDDDDAAIDVLGAPIRPGDRFLVTTLGLARALDIGGLARPLRELGDDPEALASAARSLGDGAIAAGVRQGALVVARA
ncbi:MAG: hypothetical protein CMN30_23755 [Sandaracinus sp.]|nr:hypothetical protein [Sandaracinus sp.]